MTELPPHHLGGDGPPLVLLHGLTASWRIWQPVLGELERHHTVFAPALAGHVGGPLLEPADGGIPALAEALERTLDEAGIAKAHLCGNSLGGWLALELARRGRAETAVLLSPAGSWRTRRDVTRVVMGFELADWLLQRQHARVSALLARPGLRRMVFRSTMEHGERVPRAAAVELLEHAVSTEALKGVLAWVRTAEPAADVPDVRIRIAWAEKDRIIPFEAYGYHDRLPDAERVTLPGCGHVPMYDDPALVVRTILEVTKENT